MAGASFTFEADRAGQDRLLHSTNGPYAQWLTRVGNQIVNAAKARANVNTGLMRSSITFTLDTESGGRLVGIVGAHVNYSLYVHNGNGYYPGNPFLLDALREVLH